MFSLIPKSPFSFLNGLMGLGALLVLGALAGLVATAISGSAQLENPGTRGRDGKSLRPLLIRGKYGYVDAAGKVVIAPRFDGADSFSEGLAVVLDSGRFGYIDSLGSFAIPAKYRHARAFRDGYAPVRFDSAWLTIDRGGKPVVAALSDDPR